MEEAWKQLLQSLWIPDWPELCLVSVKDIDEESPWHLLAMQALDEVEQARGNRNDAYTLIAATIAARYWLREPYRIQAIDTLRWIARKSVGTTKKMAISSRELMNGNSVDNFEFNMLLAYTARSGSHKIKISDWRPFTEIFYVLWGLGSESIELLDKETKTTMVYRDIWRRVDYRRRKHVLMEDIVASALAQFEAVHTTLQSR